MLFFQIAFFQSAFFNCFFDSAHGLGTGGARGQVGQALQSGRSSYNLTNHFDTTPRRIEATLQGSSSAMEHSFHLLNHFGDPAAPVGPQALPIC